MRSKRLQTPALSTLVNTAPMGTRAQARVPRRIEHFQGELTTLERRVVARADGLASFAEIAAGLGLSEAEVVAVTLSLSQIGAIVLTAPPPRPQSHARIRAVDSASADLGFEVVEVEIDLSELERRG